MFVLNYFDFKEDAMRRHFLDLSEFLGDVFGDLRDGKKELRWSSGER